MTNPRHNQCSWHRKACMSYLPIVFRKARSPYQRCMASFPAQTAKFSSNYVMTSTSGGVVPLRANIKAAQFLATLAFFLARSYILPFKRAIFSVVRSIRNGNNNRITKRNHDFSVSTRWNARYKPSRKRRLAGVQAQALPRWRPPRRVRKKTTSPTQPRRGMRNSTIAAAAATRSRAARDAAHRLPRAMTGRQGHGHGHDLPDTGEGAENRGDRRRTARRARNNAPPRGVNGAAKANRPFATELAAHDGHGQTACRIPKRRPWTTPKKWSLVTPRLRISLA